MKKYIITSILIFFINNLFGQSGIQVIDSSIVPIETVMKKAIKRGFYKKLAWAGLESSSVYNTLKNKSEIQTAIRNEATNSNNAEGVKCD